MSDLATILDLQGHHDDALVLIQQAVDLSRAARHPDQHVLLGNMAGILLHKGEGRSKVTESRVCFPSGLRVCSSSIRSAGGLGAVLSRGSESGSAGRRPGGYGPDPGGTEGGEEEEEPGAEGGSTKVINCLCRTRTLVARLTSSFDL